jgi:hypothetical protein
MRRRTQMYMGKTVAVAEFVTFDGDAPVEESPEVTTPEPETAPEVDTPVSDPELAPVG